MRPRHPRIHATSALLPLAAVLISVAAPARGAPEIAESTWVDHDRRPIAKPRHWEPSYYGLQFHEGVVVPVSRLFDIPDKLLWGARKFGARTRREAVNVNAFDEVPNSSWFTNRNHRRAIPVSQLRDGPDSVLVPAKPWTIKHAKQSGWSIGFQIEDAAGRKWLVKLDPPGYPQLSSGADMVARTLIHAAGYNVPHNSPVRFHRGDLRIDEDLIRGTEGERFSEADLDTLLVQGARFADGNYSAFASLFLKGKPLGSPSMRRRRPEDSNDWYTHRHRRELRGLHVLFAWINDWDAKDHQWLDMFVETRDSLGHVQHYILDAGSSFGAGARGPKSRSSGYEYSLDFAWTGRRLVTLGFVEEPWRRANQETGIPAVGRFESEEFVPKHWKPRLAHAAFREMTDRDGYWGAKIVASFSDAQIEAAVDAAKYDDPRAREYLVRNLIVRRDRIARYWFGLVAPVDYVHVRDGALRFHDLAVDVGLERPRSYEVEVVGRGGGASKRYRLDRTELPLRDYESGPSSLSLEISVAGSKAKPTRVELTRKGSMWIVTRVRHG